MIYPDFNWQSLRDWANRNNWEMFAARDWALANNCVDFVPTIDGGFVRYRADTRPPPKYVKISKSDQ